MEIQKHIESKLQKFLTRGVDLERAQERAISEQTKAKVDGPEAWTKRIAAANLIEKYARHTALKSLVTGLPGGLASIPLTFIDAGGVLSARAELAVALHLLVDDEFTKQEDWRSEVLSAAFALPEVSAQGARSVATRIIRDVVATRGVRFVAKRLGRRLFPVVGGLFSAGMTYRWMHLEGKRMASELV
ncbi:MAG: hypothetical protein ACI9KE_001941 [Polyangiales bacterium]|jgi:hypothetical protein